MNRFKLLIAFFVIFMHQNIKSQEIPEMITIPVGEFQMGDNAKDSEADEMPIHRVLLSEYSISKTEITIAQWKVYCNETNKKMPMEPNWGWHENHPIVNITWEDAVAYTEWLSDKTGKTYRLPTEAEWEYAARGGAQSKGFKFSGGKSVELVAWMKSNSNGGTNPVGLKTPNELGLYDMTGNIYEWCLDWYDLYKSEDQKDPKVLIQGIEKHHVIRGGSWRDEPKFSRINNRYFSQYSKGNFIGFRIVRVN